MASQTLARVDAEQVWAALWERFPDNLEGFRHKVRYLFRHRGLEAAKFALHERFLPIEKRSPIEIVQYGHSLDDIGSTVEAEQIFELVSTSRPLNWRIDLELARAHRKRGNLLETKRILESITDKTKNPAIEKELEALSILNDPEYLSEVASETYIPAISIRRLACSSKPRPSQTKAIPRILLINATLGPGGAERQFSLLGSRLADHARVSVDVWCRSLREKSDSGFFANSITVRGQQIVEFGKFPPGPKLPREIERLVVTLPPALRDNFRPMYNAFMGIQPSAVHIWQEGTIATATLPALLAGVPKIILSLRSQPPAEKGKDRPYYRHLLRNAVQQEQVKLVVNSERARAAYAKWIGMDSRQIGLIYNGIVEPDPVPNAVRRRDHPFLVGGIMRFDENKRPDLWIETALNVLAEHPSAQFEVIGSGPLLADCRNRISKLGLNEKIRLLGTIDDVSELLQRASVILLTSQVEGLPNALAEAQMSGVPVVSSNAGGAAEAFIPGESGLLALEPDLARQASHHIVQLIENPMLRRSMSENAKKFARSRFGLKPMIEHHLDLYGISRSPSLIDDKAQ